MYHLAQVNIARLLAPLDDPSLAGFVGALDEVNEQADQSVGFVWRLQTEAGNATELQPYDDNMIILNMSVWENLASLNAFVYHQSRHRDIMRQRRQWFERFEGMYMALWWIPEGHIPTIQEAKDRIESLNLHGPTPYAFSFKQPFPAPSSSQPVEPMLTECDA